MKKESESLIQQSIFQYFNNKYCLKHHSPSLLIFSVPNGIQSIVKDPKERSRVLNSMSKTGAVNGISDLIIHGIKGRSVMVEVKNSDGKQSDAQRNIENKVNKLGGVYLLVRSLSDFQKQIEPHLLWLTKE